MTAFERVVPVLTYQDIEAAHDFLVRAFGFVSGGLHRTPEGQALHGEVRAGDAAVWLHRVAPEHHLVSPLVADTANSGLFVHVDDVDAHYERARAAGARIDSEPVDRPYGQREYGARDLEGHRWWFAARVASEDSRKRVHAVRNATIDDVLALAKLHVQTFNETHRGGRSGGPPFELRERQWREAFSITDGSWFCFVVEDPDGELVAFAKGTPYDGGMPGFAGELNKIYVLRRVQRQGVGRLLLYSVARRFLSQGVTSMLLFGEAANPSNGFYEAFGAERLYSDRGEFHGAYGWRDLQRLVARCEDWRQT